MRNFFLSLMVFYVCSSHAETNAIRTLSASCNACHGTNGNSIEGTLSLAGLSAQHFIQKMQQFKSGTRQATVMHHHAKGLTDAEIEALADYFASLSRTPPTALPKQSFKGEQ